MLTNTPCLVCTAVPKNYKAKTNMYTLNLKAHQDTVRCSDIQQGSIPPPPFMCTLSYIFVYFSEEAAPRHSTASRCGMPEIICLSGSQWEQGCLAEASWSRIRLPDCRPTCVHGKKCAHTNSLCLCSFSIRILISLAQSGHWSSDKNSKLSSDNNKARTYDRGRTYIFRKQLKYVQT